MDRANCHNCENLQQTQEGQYWCGVSGENINSIKGLPDNCPRKKSNCHNYCRFGKYCRYLDGGIGNDPEECAMYYKIDDLLMEAEDVRREQERERGEEEEDW